MAEVFLGETNGYFSPTLTADDLADNWATVTDRTGYAVPQNLGEETALFLPFLK